MKLRRITERLSVIILLIFPLVKCAFCGEPKIILTVANDLNIDRPKEIVTVELDAFAGLIPDGAPSGLAVIDEKSGKELTSQIIFRDQKSVPEELIFFSDFKPNETKNFIIKLKGKESESAQSLTDARFMPPREDLAWENDRIAFRMYGPAMAKEVKNGIDVWNKRVRYLIVEKWYKGDETPEPNRVSYHEDHGEGADFFNVGKTLGVGACSLFNNDSLYQPGVFEKYRIIATGPVRCIFELDYKPVVFAGKNISETMRVSLDAGSNLNKIEIIYKSDSSGQPLPIAVGIVKRPAVKSYWDEINKWASLWGPTNEKAENGFLGTGIVMPGESFREFREDSIHVLILGNAAPGKYLIYYAGAGWTRSGDFKSVEDWNHYLAKFSQRIASPLKVNIRIEK